MTLRAVLPASPGERLRFQWLLDDTKTTVDIELAPSGAGTELTLTQWPLPTRSGHWRSATWQRT